MSRIRRITVYNEQLEPTRLVVARSVVTGKWWCTVNGIRLEVDRIHGGFWSYRVDFPDGRETRVEAGYDSMRSAFAYACLEVLENA